MKTYRLFLGFLIAPISFGLVASILSYLVTGKGLVFWAVSFSAIIGYPIAILLGVPLFFLMQRLKLRGLIAYSLVSLLVALPLILIFAVRPAFVDGTLDLNALVLAPRMTLIVWIFGVSLFNVVVFWLIARPDLDT